MSAITVSFASIHPLFITSRPEGKVVVVLDSVQLYWGESRVTTWTSHQFLTTPPYRLFFYYIQQEHMEKPCRQKENSWAWIQTRNLLIVR